MNQYVDGKHESSAPATGEGSSGASHPSSVVDPTHPLWVATEKIHGAQLQLYCGLSSGTSGKLPTLVVAAAKRSGWLAPLDSFFGFQEVVRRLGPAIRFVIEQLVARRAEQSELRYVVLYGELFGGWYPSESLASKWRGWRESASVGSAASASSAAGAAATAGNRADAEDPESLLRGAARPVQQGVYYSPRKEFFVFDCAVVNSNHDARLLPFHQLEALCEASQTAEEGGSASARRAEGRDAGRLLDPLIAVPVVARGSSYSELVSDLSLDFDSKVPAVLNHLVRVGRGEGTDREEDRLCQLPSLPAGTNTAEGVVMRPNDSSKSAVYKGSRVVSMVKHKHEKFGEIEEIDKPRGDEPPAILVARVFDACLTPNRVRAVRSKITEEEAKDPEGRILSDLVSDVLEAFWTDAPREYQDAYAKLSEEEISGLESDLNKKAVKLLRTLLQ
uniref:RNA ligase domain-containing protein n=1 Tax=Chromera velia CCMP2878 TaxID=1169474 RepID=A0A0G4FKJ3_9ALVE|eukprot:Cvel_3464.t1-p1 / transcript=Cvel_3464.t1 / gene=Cvel_3464 / organism=Chromera_velia_CCMP2878 / gene_product=hypothetical protein / transcript_product=hypothetical protein / location=Cvel_scaffold139:122275-123846(+) / protein_length=446 / sequence_SO=supercontig / SO=protein_coding / is_pseudo=false